MTDDAEGVSVRRRGVERRRVLDAAAVASIGGEPASERFGRQAN